MTDFNPLSGAVMGSAQTQQQMNVSKQAQARRTQAARKNIAANDEPVDHQVESSEEIVAIHDGQRQQPDPRQKRRQDKTKDAGEPPHIDLKA